MTDVNARAGGTLNQDPFSVNMSDGVGQGQEPEISPTAPDDDLNKNADELEYLNDTDHSTMLNETNLIQSMQETLAANDSGDHEFRGDFQDHRQTLESLFDQIGFLKKHRRRISNVGISTNDIFSIESRYPKMLVRVGNGFTLESTYSNNEFALEAINKKIGEFILAAARVANKIIDWIIDRFKKLDSWYADSKLRNMLLYIREIFSKKEILLTPTEICAIVPKEYFEQYFESKVNIEAFNSMFKSNLSLNTLNALPKRSAVIDITKILSGLQGEAPGLYNNMAEIYELVFSVSSEFGKINELLNKAERLTKGEDVDIGDISIEAFTPPPLVGLNEIGNILNEDSAKDLSKMNRMLSGHVKAITRIKDLLKVIDQNSARIDSPELVEKYRIVHKAIQDSLMQTQLKINEGNKSTIAYSRATATIIALHDCLKNTNVKKLTELYRNKSKSDT